MERNTRFRFAFYDRDRQRLDKLAQLTFRSRVNVLRWLLWSATGGNTGISWAMAAELQKGKIVDESKCSAISTAMTFSVPLSEDEHRRLRALAGRLQCSRGTVMRLLLRLAASELEHARLAPDALPPLPLRIDGDVEEWGWQQPQWEEPEWRQLGWEDVL